MLQNSQRSNNPPPLSKASCPTYCIIHIYTLMAESCLLYTAAEMSHTPLLLHRHPTPITDGENYLLCGILISCITHFVTTYRVEGWVEGHWGAEGGGCMLWVRVEGNNWNETKGARAVNNEPTHHVASGLLNEHHEYFKAVQYSQGMWRLSPPSPHPMPPPDQDN